MSDKQTSAEKFTKEVSPTKDGIRQQLLSYGFLKHIHNWLDRFSDLKTKNLQDDFAQQKIANTILAEQNINCCNRIIELKNELRQCKELANIQNKRWAERNEILQSDLKQFKEDNKEFLEALEKIMKWELPETNEFWDEDKKRPMSYESCYGSNGARDYIKNIAYSAISNKQKQTKD